MTTAVAERVAKGAELLDSRKPGWADDIDTERLSMAYADACVLAQLYDDYYDGGVALGLVETNADGDEQDFLAYEHGFTARSKDDYLQCMNPNWSSYYDWAALDAAWYDAIVARLN